MIADLDMPWLSLSAVRSVRRRVEADRKREEAKQASRQKREEAKQASSRKREKAKRELPQRVISTTALERESAREAAREHRMMQHKSSRRRALPAYGHLAKSIIPKNSRLMSYTLR